MAASFCQPLMLYDLMGLLFTLRQVKRANITKKKISPIDECKAVIFTIFTPLSFFIYDCEYLSL